MYTGYRQSIKYINSVSPHTLYTGYVDSTNRFHAQLQFTPMMGFCYWTGRQLWETATSGNSPQLKPTKTYTYMYMYVYSLWAVACT